LKNSRGGAGPPAFATKKNFEGEFRVSRGGLTKGGGGLDPTTRIRFGLGGAEEAPTYGCASSKSIQEAGVKIGGAKLT